MTTTSHTTEPTAWLLQLTDADTAAAQWVLGTEEAEVGFFGEWASPAPGSPAGAAPDEDIATWVADVLGVGGVELTLADDESRWSVALVTS